MQENSFEVRELPEPVVEQKITRKGPLPRSLRDRSCYLPHQGQQERTRRRDQALKGYFGDEVAQAVLSCLYVKDDSLPEDRQDSPVAPPLQETVPAGS